MIDDAGRVLQHLKRAALQVKGSLMMLCLTTWSSEAQVVLCAGAEQRIVPLTLPFLPSETFWPTYSHKRSKPEYEEGCEDAVAYPDPGCLSRLCWKTGSGPISLLANGHFSERL